MPINHVSPIVATPADRLALAVAEVRPAGDVETAGYCSDWWGCTPFAVED